MSEHQKMDRRKFIRRSVILAGSAFMAAYSIPNAYALGTTKLGAKEVMRTASSEASKVYMMKDITSANMIRLYEVLGRKAEGKTAVKLSTGEPGGHNFLQPDLIADLIKKVNGTIVECNTAYAGGRSDTESHMKAAKDHGFTAIANVDIMDAEGEVSLPVEGGSHLKENYVGSHCMNYDFMMVLSHFKGHPMGGFGGALKNISIGVASAAGKVWIHTAGKSKNDLWNNLPSRQEDFLESMAEAAQSVMAHFSDKMVYINVMNRLSVDCDCLSNPEEPKMADIGILASLDPVALDKACVDQVYSSSDPGRVYLIERMESRKGIQTVVHAEALGLGTQNYELISLD